MSAISSLTIPIKMRVKRTNATNSGLFVAMEGKDYRIMFAR